MARVDYEQVLIRLKAHIASKPNHGQRDLLAAIASLEGEALVTDDAYRTFLSRFGEEVAEAVLNTLPDPPAIPSEAASSVVTREAIQPFDTPAKGDGGDVPWKQEQEPVLSR